MSAKELDRYTVLKMVLGKEIKQKHASQLLNISDRQIRNLLKCLSRDGPTGIVSKLRGKPR